MKYDRVYNFSAGPSILPVEVLESVRDNLLNYEGSGMCVMEMSHRSKVFQQIIDEAEQDLRDLMNIPDNYKVMFIQGGATLQFAMLPMNLMKNGVADYIVTGNWSKKAYNEAKKYARSTLLQPARIAITATSPIVPIFPSVRMRIMFTSAKTRRFTEPHTRLFPTPRARFLFPTRAQCSFQSPAMFPITALSTAAYRRTSARQAW